MRIGLRLAVSGLVLLGTISSALGVHFLWYRTAQSTSRDLSKLINDQIVSAVGNELFSITVEAKSAYIGTRALFVRHVLDASDANKRELVLLSQLQSQPTLSWVAFAAMDGALTAAHKRGDTMLESFDIPAGDGPVKQQVERFEFVDGDFQFESRREEQTSYKAAKQNWFVDSTEAEGSTWFNVTSLPVGERLAVALAGPIDVAGERKGVLAVIVELARVSRFLSELAVGKSGAAFILDRDGTPIAVPDPKADELNPVMTNPPMLSVAIAALKQASKTYRPENADPYRMRFEPEPGAGFEVNLTPLTFPGWSLATVIPESEFIGPVEQTIRQLVLVVIGLILLAAVSSVLMVQRLIVTPLLRVSDELRRVERFELEQVQRHPSRINEIANLSGAIADMATGLSAFRKYIPADLVRLLVSEGTEAKLGGTVKPMTVMFIDIAGFTGLSERLGDHLIPLLSRYFDAMSAEIQANGGTIDKFIGDAVMAFWGAPSPTPDHALACCRAALACQRAIVAKDLRDETGRLLEIRIGINSGACLVGNIGSEVRLNYTVIGDTVNVASRLEGASKRYGTNIIIGEETRRLAGDQILVRELDRLAVYGREAGIAVYELLGLAEEGIRPEWAKLYEDGLDAYRRRNFDDALSLFSRAASSRDGGDLASDGMIKKTRAAIEVRPGVDWRAITVADEK